MKLSKFLKENGAYESYVKNFEKDNIDDIYIKSLRQYPDKGIIHAFNWTDSQEGFKYWDILDDEWRAIENQENDMLWLLKNNKEQKPENNFEKFGFKADFKGEILKEFSNKYLGYVCKGITAEWEKNGKNIYACVDRDEIYNLTPIKKECHTCKHWDGNYCSKLGISIDIGGCGDYWEGK